MPDTVGQVSSEQQSTGALALAQQTGLDLSHLPPGTSSSAATEWQKRRASTFFQPNGLLLLSNLANFDNHLLSKIHVLYSLVKHCLH